MRLILFLCSFAIAQNLTMELLDVGQGLSFLLKNDSCSVLYDIGTPESRMDTILQNRGITELCAVVISHWHDDHYGGLKSIMGNMKIRKIAYANDIPLKGKKAMARDSLLKKVGLLGISLKEMARGDTLADLLPFTITALWPVKDDVKSTENGASLVLLVNDGNKSLLLTGDLGEQEERKLMKLDKELKADYLQVGHHGSATSSSAAFLWQLSPKETFIGVGVGNTYKHPRPETIIRLKAVVDSVNIHRTDLEGSVKMDF